VPLTDRLTARCLIRTRLAVASLLCLAGCATPQYAIRSTPLPDESADAVRLERTISAYQAKEFEQQHARLLAPGERVFGFNPQSVVDRLSRVTERPYLQYRVFMYRDADPNAAALADGRVYVSTGMLDYLASRGPEKSRSDFQDSVPDMLRMSRGPEKSRSDFQDSVPDMLRMSRGSRESELAFILGHELAHTVAQHLVKRYEQMQQQQLLLSLVDIGAAVATRGQSSPLGSLASDVAGLVADVAASGYGQEQELEADQLGIQYVARAGYDPQAALDLLDDFKRFDTPMPFLRTHPYIERRRQDLERYIQESGLRAGPASRSAALEERERRRAHLLQIQHLYPVGSQSWKNLQQQLDALEH